MESKKVVSSVFYLKKNCLASVFILASLFLTNFVSAQTVYDAAFNSLRFSSNQTAKVGNGENQGNIVLFDNVITIGGQVIDAVVTTTTVTNVSSFDNYDDNSSDTNFFHQN